ncbi:MAG: TetR/AcrR family transcriptional regulator C-terminal domain-containing protein [Ilumatobacteraceae bacterium]
MARPATLSRDRIVDAAVALATREGADALTVRRLGEQLGCDPSALYRHFTNAEALHRAVGDHFLADVDVAPRPREGWRTAVRRLCIELRHAQLRQPKLAAFVRAAPTRLGNELAITEALLRELRRGGFRAAAAVRAYHSLIELTVGSAAIDAPLAALASNDRAATYDRWRADYGALDPAQFPASVAVAPLLYQGTADERFEQALDLLLDGLMSRRRVAN